MLRYNLLAMAFFISVRISSAQHSDDRRKIHFPQEEINRVLNSSNEKPLTASRGIFPSESLQRFTGSPFTALRKMEQLKNNDQRTIDPVYSIQQIDTVLVGD